MEELLIKISEILGMSVESLQLAYPILRKQYIWYRIIDSINTLSLTIAILSSFIIITLIIILMISYNDYYNGYFYDDIDEFKPYKKIIKILIVILTITLLIILGTSILNAILSPDLMILKELL